jgi:hypothetical protein
MKLVLCGRGELVWIPASAGMTKEVGNDKGGRE